MIFHRADPESNPGYIGLGKPLFPPIRLEAFGDGCTVWLGGGAISGFGSASGGRVVGEEGDESGLGSMLGRGKGAEPAGKRESSPGAVDSRAVLRPPVPGGPNEPPVPPSNGDTSGRVAPVPIPWANLPPELSGIMFVVAAPLTGCPSELKSIAWRWRPSFAYGRPGGTSGRVILQPEAVKVKTRPNPQKASERVNRSIGEHLIVRWSTPQPTSGQ